MVWWDRLLREIQRLGWATVIRRGIAYLLAVALVGVVIGGYFGLHVCRDAIATVGTKAVVQTCGPIGVIDLAPVAVLIALLLIPDLSQVDLFGVISLHREVKEVGRKQEQVVSELVQVRTAVNQSLAASQNMNVNVMMSPGAHEARAEVEQKVDEFLTQPYGFATPSPVRKSKPPPGAARARKEAELISLWEDIRAYLGLVGGRSWRNDPSETLTPTPTPFVASIVAEWSATFADQINVVRAARNSVAHAVPVSNEDLDTALTVGRRTLDALDRRLGQFRDPQGR
jgi:hypothetical protein